MPQNASQPGKKCIVMHSKSTLGKGGTSEWPGRGFRHLRRLSIALKIQLFCCTMVADFLLTFWLTANANGEPEWETHRLPPFCPSKILCKGELMDTHLFCWKMCKLSLYNFPWKWNKRGDKCLGSLSQCFLVKWENALRDLWNQENKW